VLHCARPVSLLAMPAKSSVRRLVCAKRVSVRSTRSANSASQKNAQFCKETGRFFMRWIYSCDSLSRRLKPALRGFGRVCIGLLPCLSRGFSLPFGEFFAAQFYVVQACLRWVIRN